MKRIDEKYEVIRELGAGGMGAVYEARHERTGRRVAIKVIKEEAKLEPTVVERFQREAKAAGSIESDYITSVLDGGVDRESGAPYLVMELLAGEDLDDALKRIGPFRPEVAARIVAQMLMGLERAHDAGVTHRDIKPANVFLARKGNSVVVKVGDFGVAKIKPNAFGDTENNALTQSSSLLGSPTYMSPEQAKGSKSVDSRTDLWATGVVLYQLLVGATPHAHADTLGLLLLAICSEKVEPVTKKAPWVSPKLEAIVARALEMDADARFQTARQMLDVLIETIPDGKIDLDTSMFVPLSDEERAPLSNPAAFAKTRFDGADTPAPATKPPEVKSLESSVNASLSTSVNETLSKAPPARSRWIYIIAPAAAVVGAIGFVGARLATSQPPVNASALVAPPPPPAASSSPIVAETVPQAPIESAPPVAAVVDAGPKIVTAATRAPAPPATKPSAQPKPSASAAPPPAVSTAAPTSSGVLRKWP